MLVYGQDVAPLHLAVACEVAMVATQLQPSFGFFTRDALVVAVMSPIIFDSSTPTAILAEKRVKR